MAPPAFTLDACPSIHCATVGIICEKCSSALQRLFPLHSDEISPPQCQLQGLYDIGPICFSNHFWCIFIHYPLTTKTVLHFLKLIYGFITSDTPHALLSQWISSALLWLLPVILSLERASSSSIQVRLASLCFQTTSWSSQHSHSVNYVCVCISIPCPTTQTSGWHASHLLHHNTNVVSRKSGIQKVPSKYLFK